MNYPPSRGAGYYSDLPLFKPLFRTAALLMVFGLSLFNLNAQNTVSYSPHFEYWKYLQSFNESRFTRILCARNIEGRLTLLEDDPTYDMDSTGYIRTFDGSQWSPDTLIQFDTRYGRVRSDRNFQSAITDVVKFQGYYYISGNFHSVDSIPGTAGIARYYITTKQWESVGGGVDTNVNYRSYTIRQLCVFQNKLYALGDFNILGAGGAKSIAVWDGNSWQPVGGHTFDVNTPHFKHMTTDGTALYVSGNFNSVGTPAVSALNVAKWDGSVWSAVPAISPVEFMKYEESLQKVIAYTGRNAPLKALENNQWIDIYPAVDTLLKPGAGVTDFCFHNGRFYLTANEPTNFPGKLIFNAGGGWTEGSHQLRANFFTGLYRAYNKLYVYGSFYEASHRAVNPINVAEINDYIGSVRGFNFYDKNRNCVHDNDTTFNFCYNIWKSPTLGIHRWHYAYIGGYQTSAGTYATDAPPGEYLVENAWYYCRDTVSCGTDYITETAVLDRNRQTYTLPDFILREKDYFRDYRIWAYGYNGQNLMNRITGQDSAYWVVRNESSTASERFDFHLYSTGSFFFTRQIPVPERFTSNHTTDSNVFLLRHQSDTFLLHFNVNGFPPRDTILRCDYLFPAVDPPPTSGCFIGCGVPLRACNELLPVCRRHGRHPAIRCRKGRSYDPNVKKVNGSHTCNGNDCIASLNYTITFQNTGTAPAELVIVSDFLPGNAEQSTLEYVSSSHPCRLSGTNFIFENINLPDSATSPAGSIGSVTYRLRSKIVHPGDCIINSAAVYFDDNEPVNTNLAVYCIPIEDSVFAVGSLKLNGSRHPSGSAIDLRWVYAGKTDKENEYYVLYRSADGLNYERIAAHTADRNACTDFAPLPGTNHYRLERRSKNKNFSPLSAYTRLDWQPAIPSGEEILIYPNPTDKEITLTFKGNINVPIKVQLLNSLGQELKTERLPDENRRLSFDFQRYPEGIYLIRVLTETGTVIRTERIVYRP